MNDTLRYTTSDDFLQSSSTDSSVVLLHNGTYYSLEDTGAVIWRSLGGGPRTLNEIVDAVRDIYAIDAATVRKDVSQLLAELMESGLVRTHA